MASLCTRGRYENFLPMAILSLATQTHKIDHIRIFDDNEESKDIRNDKHFWYLMVLLEQKGIGFDVVFGQKKGQHYNDEMANTAGFDLVLRFDDDCVAEPTYLEELLKEMKDGIGAVGGLVLKPPYQKGLPSNAQNKIDNIYAPNIQWFDWEGEPKEVEHLYSSFLYRAGIDHFDLRLSQVAFRGETMFNHSLFLRGYKLIVTPKARAYHFEASGGCRTEEQEQKRKEMYYHDEQIFRQWLAFKKEGKKIYVLNNGLGDHYMFRQVITPSKDDVLAVCYPDAFSEYKCISIQEASMYVDIKDYDIYAWCAKNNWKGHLKDAFIKMYEGINHRRG